MKTIIRLFAFLALFSLVTSGCKKDKKDDNKSNYFSYEGKDYNISKSYIEDWGSYDDGVYEIDLSVLSSGITIHTSDGEVDSLSGTGNALHIEFLSSTAGKIASGEYTFDDSGDDNPFTFYYGVIAMNYNFQSDLFDFVEFGGGKITVKNSGNEYEITLDLTSSDGKAIKGYYKGTPAYYDYTKKKKSGSFR